VIAETRALMQAELEEARKEIEQLRRQARSGFTGSAAAGHEDFLVRAEKELSRRKQATEEVNQRVIVPGKAGDRLTGPVEVGDIVWVASLQASGEVLAVYDASDEADVQLGNFRLKLPMKRMELRQKAVKEAAAPAVKIRSSSPAPSPGIELDLRGERVEDGLERLERYLNDAYRARLPFVRIIHGHGTGAMKSAVRDVLKHHPLVNTMRAGEGNEGGDGVTMVKLVNS
jgi:DNA mismatch repair protein MutS2